MEKDDNIKNLIEEAVFRSLILEKLEQQKIHAAVLDDKIQEVSEKLQELNENKISMLLSEIAALKVKSSLWGGLAGLVVSIVSIIAALISLKG